MPFREHGPKEGPVLFPGAKGGMELFPQPINPRQMEDLDIEWDQKLHRDAERIDAQEQYNSPIMENERRQRRLDRQARKAAPKLGEFNLVPPGRNPFGPPGPPVGPPPVPPPPGPAQ